MDDSDVIAYLYPYPGRGLESTRRVFDNYMGSPMYVPPPASSGTPSPDPHHRQSTEEPEDPADGGNVDKSYGALAIRFSVGARSRVGVVIGTDHRADIVAYGVKGVSGYHAAITFDSQNRVIVRDLGSTCGTRVAYGDDTSLPSRTSFDWLLKGPSILGPDCTMVVHLAPRLQIQVVVPAHDITSPRYLQKVDMFRRGTSDPQGLFASLVLGQSRPSTEIPSGVQTPLPVSAGPVYLTRNLGQGGFGVVSYCWNATTGEEFAQKEPRKDLIRRGAVKLETWKKEASILRGISHEHIVTFFGDESVPYPRIRFEYMPGGSLESLDRLSTFENAQILCQLLSALEYLHTLNPPIAHRDIKPANILVEHRRPYDIRVKFGDFGLAKAAHDMSTVCGTMYYAAPEIFNKYAGKPARHWPPYNKYGVAVDIYSCGVTIAGLECGLPAYDDSYELKETAWACNVRNFLETHAATNELVEFLLESMVVINPQERKNASECLAGSTLVFGSISLQSGTSTPWTGTVGAGGGPAMDQGPTNVMRAPASADRVHGALSPNSSLIGKLGYLNSSLIDSIVNPSEPQGTISRISATRESVSHKDPPPRRPGQGQGEEDDSTSRLVRDVIGGYLQRDVQGRSAHPPAPSLHDGKRLRSGRQVPSAPVLDKQESGRSSSGSKPLPPGKRRKGPEASH